MSFAALIERMTQAACRGDGAGVGACFTEGGVYHDVFYGPFEGPAAIADMIDNHFHRDGENFPGTSSIPWTMVRWATCATSSATIPR